MTEPLRIQIPEHDIEPMIVELESPIKEDRRYAVQTLVDRGNSPIASIKCWPKQKCSELQLAAAEATLREWLEYTAKHPFDGEDDVIDALFPTEVQPDEDQPRVRTRRTLRSVIPPAPLEHFLNKLDHLPVPLERLGKKLDEWSENIKERMLDWDITPEENALADSEGQDLPLAPLDRDRFAEQVRGKVAETIEHVTDTLAAARTDYELVTAEQAIHPMLSTLRWDLISAALELRCPDVERLSAAELSELAESLPSPSQAKPEPRPTADWAKRYRRMRAAGF